MRNRDMIREELREVAWVASVVFSLSAFGVGMAVGLAFAVAGGTTVFGAV